MPKIQSYNTAYQFDTDTMQIVHIDKSNNLRTATLNRDAAETLLFICNAIARNPAPRSHNDRLYDSLLSTYFAQWED